MSTYEDLLKEISEEGTDVDSVKIEIVSEYVLDDDRLCELLVSNSKELATYIRQYAEGVSIAGVWSINLLIKQIMAEAKEKVAQEVWEHADEKAYGGLM